VQISVPRRPTVAVPPIPVHSVVMSLVPDSHQLIGQVELEARLIGTTPSYVNSNSSGFGSPLSKADAQIPSEELGTGHWLLYKI
jgi:hypothetical protein